MNIIKLYRKFRPIDWVFMAIIVGVTVLQVYLTMEMTDNIQSAMKAINLASAGAGDSSDIWKYTLLYLALALGGTLCQVATAILASAITASFSTRVREEIYKKVSSYSLAEINRFSTSSLITRTTNDLEHVQMTSLMIFRMFFSAPITAVWAICKIQASSSELTLVTIAGVIAIIVILLVVLFLVYPKFMISQKLIDRLNGVTRESVLGIRVVRAYNGEEYQEEKFDKANKDLMKLNLFTSRLISLFNPVITIVLDGVTLGIYFVGAGLVNGFDNAMGRIEMYSTLVAFSALAIQVIMSFMMLLFMFILLPRAEVAAKRVQEVLLSKSSIVDPEHPVTPNEKGTIEFKDVSFKYPGSENEIIRHVNFTAKQGDTIAVIGATGCGKTTLVNLIARLYDATSGEVLVDGVNVKDLAQKDLRSHIGFIPQKGLLFSGTVASNICLGLEDIDEDAMKKAAQVACAEEFILQMEGQYESHIAQGGTNVSGGQRQRLCIARAAAIDPEIFVFDDSFSALDFKTDRQVRKNLAEGYPNATKVIVAQRVGTIMDADLILVLENGDVVGQGTHKELLDSCPTYRDIALSQLSKEELGL